jgi:hypothetical protein
MAAAPDSLAVTGSTFQQVPVGSLLVTPTNGTQAGLAAWMANPIVPGLLRESASDSLTAHAGGGQGSALALVSELNRVTTVASAGDSVALPASAPGLTIFIENAGANAMQVYGAGTDTINGVATATGVSQMANSVVVYTCYTAGAWFAANLGTGYFGSLESSSAQTGLTAHAGGGQGSAVPITAMIAQFSTVATTGDSAVLPSAAGLPAGTALTITVINNGANSMNVFCPAGSTMNGTSNGSASVTNTTPSIFFATSPTAWVSK